MKIKEVCKHSIPTGVEVIEKLIKALKEIRLKANSSEWSLNKSLDG